jgi:hypothetical protein
MPTQEERLSIVEQAQVRIAEAVSDLNHHVTMLIGIVQRQEWDIREMKGSLRTFEQSVNSRFESLEGRFDAQDTKLDQMLRLLTTLTTKSDQET